MFRRKENDEKMGPLIGKGGGGGGGGRGNGGGGDSGCVAGGGAAGGGGGGRGFGSLGGFGLGKGHAKTDQLTLNETQVCGDNSCRMELIEIVPKTVELNREDL